MANSKQYDGYSKRFSLTTWKIGEKRKKLEEKGIIMRFVIGHR